MQNTIEGWLRQLHEERGSDLFVTADAPPCIKVNGKIRGLTTEVLLPDEVEEIIADVMNERQREEYDTTQECQFAISLDGDVRFRVSAFYQQGMQGMVCRRIETSIPTTEDLDLPEVLNDLSMEKRGIILFVGATGTGKSTSLAAMMGHRNRNMSGHIITIEDPIEYVHFHDKSIITQREVGVDTESFEVALKNTLRQAPDVIMIGEVREAKTMMQALTFAETGHLCLCTLHANNANQALDRIQSFFPPEQHRQVWMDLSLNLKAMVAQQLLPRKDGQGRTPVVEVMLNSPQIADYIRKGEVHLIKDLMAKSTELGMQTLDQSLVKAYKENLISKEDAIRYADSANDVRLEIKMLDRDQGGGGDEFSLSFDEKDDTGRFMGRS